MPVSAQGATEFALSVIATVGGFELLTDGVELSRQRLDRLAEMYRSVLETMLADPDGDSRQACLPAGERERLLGRPAHRNRRAGDGAGA